MGWDILLTHRMWITWGRASPDPRWTYYTNRTSPCLWRPLDIAWPVLATQPRCNHLFCHDLGMPPLKMKLHLNSVSFINEFILGISNLWVSRLVSQRIICVFQTLRTYFPWPPEIFCAWKAKNNFGVSVGLPLTVLKNLLQPCGLGSWVTLPHNGGARFIGHVPLRVSMTSAPSSWCIPHPILIRCPNMCLS